MTKTEVIHLPAYLMPPNGIVKIVDNEPSTVYFHFIRFGRYLSEVRGIVRASAEHYFKHGKPYKEGDVIIVRYKNTNKTNKGYGVWIWRMR